MDRTSLVETKLVELNTLLGGAILKKDVRALPVEECAISKDSGFAMRGFYMECIRLYKKKRSELNGIKMIYEYSFESILELSTHG